MAAKKFYAVKAGRRTGIFSSWEDCKAQVLGYSGAVYKGFATLQEAQQYLQGVPQVTVVAQPDAGEMVAYVDGSFNADLWRFAYGAVIFHDGNEYHFQGSEDNRTLAAMRNVAGEIRGAERAMRFALEQGASVLHIYHDYEGVARWCTGDWQANKPGTQAYRRFYQEAQELGLTVHFHKVKGHSGNTYNELADKLAKSALGIR